MSAVASAMTKKQNELKKKGLSKENIEETLYQYFKDDIRAIEGGYISPFSVVEGYYKK